MRGQPLNSVMPGVRFGRKPWLLVHGFVDYLKRSKITVVWSFALDSAGELTRWDGRRRGRGQKWGECLVLGDGRPYGPDKTFFEAQHLT